MAHKQVLLRDDIDNLGARGEIVRVKAGYARNYLLPRNLAVEATVNNVRQIEGERAALAKREAKERSSAELQADQLRSLTLKFERKVGEAGVLYGSVTSMDIAHGLKEQGYEIDRRKIVLREPIKRFGNYAVPVRLHRDVTVELPVNVLGEGGVEVDVAALEAEAGVESAAPEAPTVTDPSAEAGVETTAPEAPTVTDPSAEAGVETTAPEPPTVTDSSAEAGVEPAAPEPPTVTDSSVEAEN